MAKNAESPDGVGDFVKVREFLFNFDGSSAEGVEDCFMTAKRQAENCDPDMPGRKGSFLEEGGNVNEMWGRACPCAF